MKHKEIICILGGSGFVGTELCSRLAGEGYQVKVLSRGINSSRHLRVLPGLSVCQVQDYSKDNIAKHLTGCHALVNLIGILNERKNDGQEFHQVHVGITRAALQACEQTGVTRMLQLSALNADPDGPSYYLQTKGKAENYLRSFSGERVNVSIFRPSVIFGAGDSFLNRFAQLMKFTPIVFPLACADARFAPVYVGDVVSCMVDVIRQAPSPRTAYDLCGPKIYTLKELVEYTAKLCGATCKVISLPPLLSRLQAFIFNYFPGKPFSTDNYNSLKVDSICKEGESCRTSVEAIAPTYLAHSRALNLDRFRNWRA
jgi:NADH dehydrogenase